MEVCRLLGTVDGRFRFGSGMGTGLRAAPGLVLVCQAPICAALGLHYPLGAGGGFANKLVLAKKTRHAASKLGLLIK